MSRALVLLTPWLLCACPPPDDGPKPDDTEPVADTQPPDDTGLTCEEDAAGEIPAGVTWLETGATGNRYTIADGGLMANYTGYHGTYDLNTEEVYAASGFYLEAPATIYGARVVWGHIPGADTPAELFMWRDFSSDYYAFDIWDPYGSYTRCVDPDDEYQEITYAFPEPIEVDQPFSVFAGYHRPEVTDQDGDGQPDYLWPELVYDAPVVGGFPDDPYVAGVRFPNVDPSVYYEGTVQPFYGFEVQLAVVFDDALAPEDKPFQDDDALRASSRVAWGDYDGDGDDDLMTNGPTLYQNQGDGSFIDVTSTAIPAGAGNSSGGGVWGDYDADGCLDYFGQGGGYSAGEVLLHSNCDGTFTDTWATSGIDDTQDERDCDGDDQAEHSPTEGAGWADYDGDGLLDLYLANYECSSSYDYYKNYDDRLFRNNGDGTFTDTGEVADIETSNQAGRGVTPGDYDLDGDVDIFVSNYRLDRNFFYLNLGDGTLDNIASSNGTQGRSVSGAYGHTIGSVFGDIDNDGDFDMIHANLAHPFYYHFSDRTMVLINDGSGEFEDEAEARGIYYRETASNPVLFDADNDGDLDLFITNVYADRDSDFYLNDGSGTFQLANWESGLVVRNGWGAAAADYDNDGDVDLVAYDLFRNDLVSDNHWLQVRAVGLEGNPAARGAVVQVDSGDLSQLRMVSGGSGTSSQDSQTQHFGLGSRDSIDSITVYFPYQEDPVTITGVGVDQRVWVYSDGSHTTGWAP